VGCFSESKLALSAAAAVLLAKENVVSADLDSFYSFKNPEIGVTGGFSVERDRITMSQKPGYGFDEYEF
jgi:L-alanine-DL-glutamate epimerase-like enolase superfamily enzyme